MKKRTLLKTAMAALLFAAMPLAANAVASTAPETTAAQTARLNNLKTKGTTEIDRRVSNLNAALEKITASTKLAAADKSTLTSQMQAEITGLTNLKTKLAADTDLTVARADVASIVTDYRVYVLMLPKARLVAATDRFAVAAGKLTALEAKLQAKVDAAKTAGKDTTAMQAKLTDMTTQLKAESSATAGLTAKLLALQPSDYNAQHTLLTGYRDTMKGAQTNLKTARDDAKSVIDLLKTAK
jgi:hypothetical protein